MRSAVNGRTGILFQLVGRISVIRRYQSAKVADYAFRLRSKSFGGRGRLIRLTRLIAVTRHRNPT